MKKETLKGLVIGLMVGGSVLAVSAYNTQLWAPIQFVKQLFFTPNGERDISKATVVIDGAKGSIQAKSIYENGSRVISLKDIPVCKNGEGLTFNGENFKCYTINNSVDSTSIPFKKGDIGVFKNIKVIANGIGLTNDGYYIVDGYIVKDGCKSLLVSQPSKCILKLGNLYYAPSSTVKLEGRKYMSCSEVKIAGLKWRLPSKSELEIAYKNNKKFYGLKSDKRYATATAYGYYSNGPSYWEVNLINGSEGHFSVGYNFKLYRLCIYKTTTSVSKVSSSSTYSIKYVTTCNAANVGYKNSKGQTCTAIKFTDWFQCEQQKRDGVSWSNQYDVGYCRNGRVVNYNVSRGKTYRKYVGYKTIYQFK